MCFINSNDKHYTDYMFIKAYQLQTLFAILAKNRQIIYQIMTQFVTCCAGPEYISGQCYKVHP